MSVPTPEPARLGLYNRLGEVLGLEEADTLMSIVADHSAELLATKDDIARLERQISDLRVEFHTELRVQMRYNLATVVAMTGIFSVIVGLIT